MTMYLRPRFFLVLLFVCSIIGVAKGQDTAVNGSQAVEEECLDEVLSATDPLDGPEGAIIDVDIPQEMEPEPEPPAIEVEDYLERLNIAELEVICTDRGFDVIPRKDGRPLERNDYLEAARRCLSLEDEMNAILAKNPDLAAELEGEILRMKQHKERLEREREQLLADKALLEEQLQKAGVDLLEATNKENTKAPVVSLADKAPEDMTAKDVIVYTLSEVFDRVRQDMEIVWSVVSPVLKPVFGGLQIGWRYSKPHVVGAWTEVSKRAKQIYAIARMRVEEKMLNANNDAADKAL